MRRSARFGGFVLALALVIGACGGGSNKAASSSSPGTDSSGSSTGSSSSGGSGNASVEACKLSEDDVSNIMGFKLTKQGSGSDCTYSSLDSDSAHLGATVTFNVSPFAGGSGATQVAADAIASAFSTSPVDIPGVGDKSFFIDAGIVGELVVFTGKTQVVVAVGGLGDSSARKDQLIALAKKILN
ncbi:MAG: hypothetical protein QOG30_1306 [Acidimicrobiaceae bacterium]